MNKVMNLRFIILYFCSAVFPSILIFFLPLYYINHGFNEVQIGTLNSIAIAAAIISPVFGFLAEKKFSTKGVVIFNSMVAFFSIVCLYYAESFQCVFLLVLIYSIFQAPLYSFSDLYVANYTEKYKLNYGSFRRFAALGWGSAVFLTLPVIYLFGFNGFLVSALFFLFLYGYFFYRSEDVSSEKGKREDVNFAEQIKLLLKNKQFILLVMFACLFWGVGRIRISYQSILFSENISSDFLIALTCFMAILPEIILLPLYPQIKEKFKFGGLMFISMIFSLAILFIFSFVTNEYVLVLASSLHGMMALIYFPTIIFGIRKVVDEKIMFTAMLILGAMLSLVSFAVSMFIITPVYANLGLQAIFIVLAIISLTALYPLYKLRNLKV